MQYISARHGRTETGRNPKNRISGTTVQFVVVVAVPTDTIYGIAGLVQNSDAVNKIYAIKVSLSIEKQKNAGTYIMQNIMGVGGEDTKT